MVGLSKPKLFLAKPNKEIIADLTNEAYDINHIIKLGSISDLNFKLPTMIEINHKLVDNEHINKILFKYLIKYEIDNYIEWFVINQSTPIMNEDIDYLEVECFSLPYELNNQDLKSYSVISKTLTQIMSDILSETNWSLGYINSSFNLKFRSFEANCKVLEAVLNCATTFGAIIKWDTVNKQINFYLPLQIGNNNSLIFDYGKYLKSMNQSLDVENFCTRLKIYGQDSLTINEYNITGSNYLDDFSFFIYPYTEDINGVPLTHSNYMSDDLCHAILTYNALLLQKEGEYTGYLNTLEGYQVELTTLNNQLIVLQEQLAVIEDSLGVAQSSGTDTTSLLQQKSAKQTEITNKTTEITNKQTQINSVRSSISTLGSNLSMESNFNAEQLLELCDYIIVKEVSNEYITDAKELITWGKEEFLKISSPQILIELDIINFNQYLDEDCQLDKGKLILGDIVNIKYDKFGINVNAKITEINYDYKNGDVSLVVSNIETINRDFDKFVKQMNQAMTTSMQVDMNRLKWNGAVDKTNVVEDLLNATWDATLRDIKAGGSNENTVIDSRGITVTDPNDALKALRIMHGTIGLTQDGFNTLGVAVKSSGVAAEYLIGRIIAGEKLTISSSDGSFEVYADENGDIKVDINNGALTINGGLADSNIASADKWNSNTSIGMGVDADCLGLWHFDGSLNSHKGVSPTFTRNSVAYLSDGSQVASGVPRFEDGKFGKALMLEEGTTNIALYSKNMDNSAWNKTSYPVTVTADAEISPDGTTTMDKITAAGGDGRHFALQVIPGAIQSASYTLSIYLKKGESNYSYLGDYGDSAYHGVVFDLNSGITHATEGVVSDSGVENIGEDIYRCWLTFPRTTAGNLQIAVGPASLSGGLVYTPAATPENIYAWEIQVENKDRMTSLVKTTSSSVTRANETLTVPTSNVFNKGNWAVSFTYIPKSKLTGAWHTLWGLAIDANNFYEININTYGQIVTYVKSGGTTYTIADTEALQVGGKYTVFLGGNGSTLRLYKNGIQVGDDTAYVEPSGTLSEFMYVGANRNGAEVCNGIIDELRIDKVCRTDAEIASWYKANAPFYTSEDMKQWPGYMKAETDGVKVYDSSNNPRVLLGSWLKDAVRKYGLKIIDGEIYSTEYRTGAEGAKTYIALKPPPTNALEMWTEIGGVSKKQFALESVAGQSGAFMKFYFDDTYAGYIGLDGNKRMSMFPFLVNPSTGLKENYLSGDKTAVSGDLYASGNIACGGRKDAIELTNNYGMRYTYAVESTEVLYYDRGRVQLINGEATIYLDPIYLECIEPDTELTPWLFKTEVYGLGENIRVIEWGENYFKVKEENGGISNRKFGWWHEATRKNYAGIRLQEVFD